jgi:hypothetical protein
MLLSPLRLRKVVNYRARAQGKKQRVTRTATLRLPLVARLADEADYWLNGW